MAWQAEPVRVVFDAELWLRDARRPDARTFAGLPPGESQEIRGLAGGLRCGFGSLRARATTGASTWTTSIFPGKAGYVLPVKRPARMAGALDADDTATVTAELHRLPPRGQQGRRVAATSSCALSA
jgi:hypothetical protein